MSSVDQINKSYATAETTSLPQNKSESVTARVLRSPITWLIVVLITIDLAVATIRPLRYVKVPGVMFHDQDPINHRIETLLKSGKETNVYLLGTSLADSASANADAVQFNLKMTEYERGRYTSSKYFDALMSKELGIQTHSINVGVGGSMVSGEELILKHSVENKKVAALPTLVVFMVAPRAFIDRTREENLYPIHCYFNNRFDHQKSGESWQKKFASIATRFWNYFRLRTDYATIFTRAAADMFNKPENAFQKLKDKKGRIEISFKEDWFDPNLSNKSDWVKSVGNYYDSAYGNSVDREKLHAQKLSFERAINIVKKLGSDALIVSMPLSSYNRQKIPKGFTSEYQKMLEEISRKYDTKLIYLLDDKRFELRDFRDGVHLNGEGASKYWRILVEELEKDQKLKESFSRSPR